jgi:hypothetical protein
VKLDLTREREIQRAVIHVYEAFDCEVKRFSEGRPSRVTPGWPDLAVFCVRKATMWLHETKTATGVQSASQHHMQLLAESCGIRYILGGVREAQAHLRALDLIAHP